MFLDIHFSVGYKVVWNRPIIWLFQIYHPVLEILNLDRVVTDRWQFLNRKIHSNFNCWWKIDKKLKMKIIFFLVFFELFLNSKTGASSSRCFELNKWVYPRMHHLRPCHNFIKIENCHPIQGRPISEQVISSFAFGAIQKVTS